MRFGLMAAAAACVVAAPASAATIQRINFAGSGVITAAAGSSGRFAGADVGDNVNITGYISFGGRPFFNPDASITGTYVLTSGDYYGPRNAAVFFAINGDGASLSSFSSFGDFFAGSFVNGVLQTFDARNNAEPDVGSLTNNAFSFTTLPGYGLPAGQVSGAWEITSLQTIASVPEPATWALMILGFGAVGATMRKRMSEFLAHAK